MKYLLPQRRRTCTTVMGNRVCEKVAVEEVGWMTSFPISLVVVSSASWEDRVGAGTEGGGEGKIWSTP